MTEGIAERSQAVSDTIERALAERRDGLTPLVHFEGLCRTDVSSEAREAYIKGLRPVVEGLGASLVGMVAGGASVQSLGTRSISASGSSTARPACRRSPLAPKGLPRA